MSWAERLQVLRAEKGRGGQVAKVPKSSFGTFGALTDSCFPLAAAGSGTFGTGPLKRFLHASLASFGELRSRLLAAAEREDVAASLIEQLLDADLVDLHLLADAGLAIYARILEAGADRMRGRIPRGWNQIAHCVRCGPVVLWADAPLRVLCCPWCHVRRAGIALPRPRVTCEGCAHWRPSSQAQVGALGDCARALERCAPQQLHVCESWQPNADADIGPERKA